MKKWQKERNYRKFENGDGSFRYIVTVNGEEIEVSEEIYREYAKTERKMEYMELDLKRDRVVQDADGKAVTGADGLPVILPEREISLDKLMDEDWNFPSSGPSPEEEAIARMEVEELHHCLSQLSGDEMEIINALFFSNGGKGMSEREYAKLSGIPRKTVAYRKAHILTKLKTSYI
jgi:DNA-directed RNA polymerase sigma subunit (sigma70/sigma32)